MKTNKIVVLLMALVMVLSMTTAFAANAYPVGYEWQVGAPTDTASCGWRNAPDFKLDKEHPDWSVYDENGNLQKRGYFGLVAGDCETAETQVWGWNCITCGAAHQKHEIVAVQPAAGSAHDWQKVHEVDDTYVEATCSTAGTEVFYLDCSKCDAVTGTTTVDAAAYGHKLINEAYNHFGYKMSTTISATQAEELDYYFNTFVKMPQDGSAGEKYRGELLKKSYGLWKNAKNLTSKYTEPTCYADGKLEIKCAECKEVVFTATVTSTIQHKWVPVEVLKPATCTENGLAVFECDNEGCTKTKEEVIEAAGHKYSYAIMVDGENYLSMIFDNQADAEAEAAKSVPGCVAYDIVKICGETASSDYTDNKLTVIYCNDKQQVKSVAAKWSHDDVTVENYENLVKAGQFKIIDQSAGNCTNEAYVVVKCAGAEKTNCPAVKKLVLKEAGHVWQAIETGTVKKEATCTAEGEMIVKCVNWDNCKATTIMPIEKKEHVPYETLQDATDCSTEGKITIKCNVCQNVIDEKIIPAGHIIINGVRENCTRNANGKLVITNCLKDATEKGYCSRCELYNQVNTYKAKAEHTKPAKLVKGTNYEVVREATCQQTGITKYDCAACAQTRCIEEITPVTAHFSSTNDPIFVAVLKAPTCTAEGVKLVKCADDTRCTETKEAPIAKIPHSFEYKNNKLVCSVCGETEDMVDGHDYKVDTKNVNMTTTSTSGIGQIVSKDTSDKLDHTKKLYARINFGYKLDNGEAVAYVACVPVDDEGNFRMASPTAPYGATLTNVTVMITTAAQAQDMLIADVPNCGVTVLR